ncbi:DNA repair protein RadA [Thioclava nitratireducens]|uniref:DNA repair protein RadA n=1 Tax=Thioclava nitratireducens TaxID=1915078 RepID=UPI0024803B70|nr:DNA repair protein RadA [Thioclava nitratireducens]WGT50908.1 DNA repair protein RadA [Thioclava nitratireducens]
MAKQSAIFRCAECGATHAKWSGRCDACGAWNSIHEEAPISTTSGSGMKGAKGKVIPLTALDTKETPPARVKSGMEELDRVLGGGLVAASAVLVGGDPGIGKSTLLLQATASFARKGVKALYISGEEAASQVRMRAQRLGLADAPVGLGAETSLRDILTTLEAERPDLVIIDSIQTMWSDNVDSAPGSVSQLRAAAHELVSFAKKRGTAVILVGHVTKEGQIAGPRVIEHMVDTVLYFEGERGHQFRILRAVKNRFGPASEIGVFEMTGAGLAEVANPSALFLSERGQPAPGSAVFAGIEGTRPVLTEIQALVAPSTLASPRRTVVGLDSGRISTILAVLESRCGIPFAGLDVFLNVAGGMRVVEPAADLAAAAALLSAREDVALPADMVIFGEISLSGALRPVGQAENRLKEAAKLGFSQAIAPSGTKAEGSSGMSLRKLGDLVTFTGEMFGAG